MSVILSFSASGDHWPDQPVPMLNVTVWDNGELDFVLDADADGQASELRLDSAVASALIGSLSQVLANLAPSPILSLPSNQGVG